MNEQEKANYELFAMDGEKMIHDENDIGIINGMLTGNGPYRNAMSVKGLFAPPFVSSDFYLEVRLFGEKVRASRFKWYPSEIVRHGESHGVKVDSSLVGAARRRAFILQVKLTNAGRDTVDIPLQIAINGTLDYNRIWEFGTPHSMTGTTVAPHGNGVSLHNNNGAIVVDTTIPGLTYCPYSRMLEGTISVGPGAEYEFTIVTAIGYQENSFRNAVKSQWTNLGYAKLSQVTATADAAALLAAPVQALEDARRYFAARVDDLRRKMPAFHSSHEPLNKWYYRSLVHLLLNQWIDVPEFFLNPYFSTGGLNGGCCCSYLWDYGANWKIWGMYNPEAARNHIKAF